MQPLVEGGALLPVIPPHRHLGDERADELGQALRVQYLSGRSVRELSADTGYPIQRVRQLLQAADTPMRPRGRHAAAAQELDLFG